VAVEVQDIAPVVRLNQPELAALVVAAVVHLEAPLELLVLLILVAAAVVVGMLTGLLATVVTAAPVLLF